MRTGRATVTRSKYYIHQNFSCVKLGWSKSVRRGSSAPTAMDITRAGDVDRHLKTDRPFQPQTSSPGSTCSHFACVCCPMFLLQHLDVIRNRCRAVMVEDALSHSCMADHAATPTKMKAIVMNYVPKRQIYCRRVHLGATFLIAILAQGARSALKLPWNLQLLVQRQHRSLA